MLLSEKNLSIIEAVEPISSTSNRTLKISTTPIHIPLEKTEKTENTNNSENHSHSFIGVSNAAIYISTLPAVSLDREYPYLPSANNHEPIKQDEITNDDPLYLTRDNVQPHTDALKRLNRSAAGVRLPILHNVSLSALPALNEMSGDYNALRPNHFGSRYKYIMETTDLITVTSTYDDTDQAHADATWPDIDRIIKTVPSPYVTHIKPLGSPLDKPTYQPEMTLCLSLAALKEIVSVYKAHDCEHVTLSPTGKASMLKTTATDEKDLLNGYVMPVSSDHVE